MKMIMVVNSTKRHSTIRPGTVNDSSNSDRNGKHVPHVQKTEQPRRQTNRPASERWIDTHRSTP